MSNLLDKASILLTPTAYNDGSMLSIKPNENLYGTEEVTNGDFATDSNWSKGTGWTISGGKANGNNTTGDLYQENVVESGKKYKVTYTISNYVSGSIRVEFPNNAYSGTLRSANGTYTETILSGGTLVLFDARTSFTGSIDNVSVVEDLSGDFTFSRSSAATRVNAQGLVENVQIISSELVSNGNFSQIGTEEVSNGNFSQIGSELVTNGDFATDSDWTKLNATISGGKGNLDGDGQTSLLYQNILTQNKSYKATFTVSNYNGLGGAAIINSNGDNYYTITENGTFTIFFKHTHSNGLFYFRAINGAIYSIDNVSVKEVGQDWTLQAGWSIGDGVATCDGTNLTQLYQTNVLTQNKLYKVTYSITSHISGGVFAKLGDNILGEINSTVGTYTEYFNFTQANLSFHFRSSNFIGSITNISVKEVGQDWTLGTGWSIGDGEAVATSGASTKLTQSISGLSGKTCKVSFTLSDYGGSGSVRVDFGSVTTDPINTNGEHIVNGTYDNNAFELFKNTGFTGSITNISVKEITDDTDLPRINYEGFSYQDVLGSEEVVNGDFSNGSAGWVGDDATLDVSNNTGKVIVTSNAEAGIKTSGVSSFVQGKQYKLTFDIVNATGGLVSGTIKEYSSSNVVGYWNGVGSYTIYFTYRSSSSQLRWLSSSNVGDILEIDNVSVKEVLGQEVVPNSGCGSWLLEPQSTNLIPYSEDFSQWDLKQGTETLNYGISPDGTQNSTRIVFASSNLQFSEFITTGASTTGSIYIKGVSGETINFGLDSSEGLFTLNGNWQRFEKSGTSTSNKITINTFSGATARDIQVWGAQVEEQSYATSYIPSNGAANTRLQDIATNSGNSTLINSTEGVLYAEIAALSSPVDSPKNITISDGTVNNYVRIEYYQDGRVYGNVYDGTSVAANFVVNQLNFNKVAIQYSSSGSKLYVNGTGVDFASKIFTSNTLNTIQFSSAAADSNYFYGKTKALAVYKEALTDAQLQSLTTI